MAAALCLGSERELGKAREKSLRALLARMLQHGVRCPDFMEHAIGDEDHAIREVVGESQFMGDEQHRPAFFREGANHAQHFADELRVERRRRLVEEKDLGVHRERARDGHPLLLPTTVSANCCRPGPRTKTCVLAG